MFGRKRQHSGSGSGISGFVSLLPMPLSRSPSVSHQPQPSAASSNSASSSSSSSSKKTNTLSPSSSPADQHHLHPPTSETTTTTRVVIKDSKSQHKKKQQKDATNKRSSPIFLRANRDGSSCSSPLLPRSRSFTALPQLPVLIKSNVHQHNVPLTVIFWVGCASLPQGGAGGARCSAPPESFALLESSLTSCFSQVVPLDLKEALLEIREKAPSLIVADLQDYVPESSSLLRDTITNSKGGSLSDLDMLLRSSKLENVPVFVMTSAHEDEESVASLLDKGVADVLSPNIAPSLLKKRIDNQLHLQRLLHSRNKSPLTPQLTKIDTIQRDEETEDQQKQQATNAKASKKKTKDGSLASDVSRFVSSPRFAKLAKGFPFLAGRLERFVDTIEEDERVFEPEERFFTECDRETKEWLMTNYTRRRSAIPTDQPLGYASTRVSLLTQSQISRLLRMWDFDVFAYSEEQLESFICQLFDTDYRLLEHFKIPDTTFKSFVHAVRTNYRSNPYHNFRHAFDVLQSVSALLEMGSLHEFFTTNDMFALLISALCHDLDHPGTNNNFQINTRSQLSLLYNDISVLENHHSCLLFKICTKEESNIFRNMDTSNFQEIRTTIISNILGTDMTHHFESLTKFQTRVALEPLCDENINDRRLLMKVLLHAADISNQAKSWKLAKAWANRVAEEFALQGDLEREYGLPVSPGMDRKTANQSQMSVKFIEVILEPFFQALADYVPTFQKLCIGLAENKKKWQEEDEEKEDTTSTASSSSASSAS